MTIRTSTEMLGIFSTDTYALYSNGDFNNYDFDYLEETEGITFLQALNKVIMPVAEELLEDALDPVISCKVKAVEVVNPREYNFTTDNTIVDISFNGNDFKKLKANAVRDPAFSKYLKDNYSSYSGFISFMADNLEKFNEQDLEEQFCQVVSFYISDSEKENYQQKFWYELLDDVYDKYSYLWIDDEDDYYNESFSRKRVNGRKIKTEEFDTVLLAIGRKADCSKINIACTGVNLAKSGKIIVDKFDYDFTDYDYPDEKELSKWLSSKYPKLFTNKAEADVGAYILAELFYGDVDNRDEYAEEIITDFNGSWTDFIKEYVNDNGIMDTIWIDEIEKDIPNYNYCRNNRIYY